MSVKGYKVFNPDWTCRDFQYEVGKTYKHDGNIEMCGAGFHFCRNVVDCFHYYFFDSSNKVAEVEAIGNVLSNGDKSVTDEIVILRELNWHEILELVNTGSSCTGYRNSGDRNSGNRNSGNRNSGDCNSGNWNSGGCNSGNCNSGGCNSGDCNSGNWNSGDFNSGNCNSGDCNSGNWNSGDLNSGNRNSGNRNSGNWNSTDFSTGFFNSVKQPLYAFNKPLKVDCNIFNNNLAVKAMNKKYDNNWFIASDDMSDEEKKNHPEHETAGGYLKTVDFKTACGIMWDNMTDEEKEAVWTIPNFDPEVFKEITGIEVRPDESRKEQEV